MTLKLIIAVGLLALVGACSAGPYSRTPAYYNGSYNNGYNGYNGYYSNNGYYGNNGPYRPYYNRSDD